MNILDMSASHFNRLQFFICRFCQLCKSMENNIEKTREFLTSATDNHSEFSTQLNSAKTQFLEQADSHSQTLQAANTQVYIFKDFA